MKTYKVLILPFASCWCENCHIKGRITLRVFEKRVLTKKFGTKRQKGKANCKEHVTNREKAAGGWKELNNDFCGLYSLPTISRFIK